MRIGIIGSGMMGSTLGPLWAKAGHDVLYSSRNPEALKALAAATPRARAVTVEEAAREGEVLFLGVPYAAMPELATTLAPLAKGKLVLDAGNIVPRREGQLAQDIAAAGTGSGTHTQQLLPAALVVKAFNTVNFKMLASQAHRAGAQVAIPLASDHLDALDRAAALVRESGFEPVVLAGGMKASARIDVGSPVWNSNMTAEQVRAALGV